jgi:hypothetical protein
MQLYFLDIVGAVVKLTADNEFETNAGMSGVCTNCNFFNKLVIIVGVTKPRPDSSLNFKLDAKMHKKS